MTTDRMLDVPKVKDILSEKMVSLTSDFSIIDAIKVLKKHKLSTIPVVNLENEVIGYLTENDCIKHATNTLYYNESLGESIFSIMSNEVSCAKQDWDIYQLEEFFDSEDLGRAPVIDLENHLIGIVTRRDILSTLMKCMNGREDYKNQINNPVEPSFRERIKMIITKYQKNISS
jgi:CBS-domain-containing membrane protein